MPCRAGVRLYQVLRHSDFVKSESQEKVGLSTRQSVKRKEILFAGKEIAGRTWLATLFRRNGPMTEYPTWGLLDET